MTEPVIRGLNAIARYWNVSRSTVKRRLKDMSAGGFVIRRWFRDPGEKPRRMWYTTPSKLDSWIAIKASKGEDF